nr:S-layer homology domain-containing protein [uncultured Dysosmobacter sp.]
MKTRIRKMTSLLLSFSLLGALSLPAAASEALGEDLSAKDTVIHEETQLSTNVFWSTAYSDLRTENLITYSPNKTVTPIVTYGGVLTDRSSVADTANALEGEGYRVVAGINGDFYNVSTGLPIGLVITDGVLRSSDAGYYAIGFRADGTAVLGKPGVKVSVDLGYAVDDGSGSPVELIRPVIAVNKARTNSGVFLYTYDFNARHTTGTTEAGVNVVCTVEQGQLAIGSTVTARVERVEETTVTSIQPDQIVLSANANADAYYTNALRNMSAGSEVTLTVSANAGWDDVEYAVGALYCLAENGAVASGLAAGVNPRTAVGQKADGTLVFYTIDGRRSGYSIGASLAQVGQRLVELGCETVLCLDGGGSTNLAVTTPDSTDASIINRPSESNRKVTNQIFLVASNRSSGRLDHFYVKAASDYVLAGSSVAVNVTGVDTNYIPMDADYDLSASAGTLENGTLTTPASGGDVTVMASERGSRGSTVVHAIRTPDTLTLKKGTASLTALTVAPGSKTTLTAGAVWNHLTLAADAKAFTWSVSGDIGTVDENGVFTAAAPGSGSLTVSAGGKSLTIPITVARQALKTVEDFEDTELIFSSGPYLKVSRTHASDYVQRGRYAGKLDYTLSADTEWLSIALGRGFSNLTDHYTALNLWVYGDGSGNQLSFLYTGDTKSDLRLPVTLLDFTGWKQVSVTLPQYFTLSGLEISVPSTTYADDSGITVEYADTPRTGTVCIDQLVGSFPGTVDNTPPAVTAVLDQQNWAVDVKVSDGVDGVLPQSSITVAMNGDAGQALEGYDIKNGTLKYYLPAPGEAQEATRVTVTAVDASGNIGRASVDIDPSGVDHKFNDISDYWAADYVDFLYNADITTGYSDGSFRPNQNISRAQFAVMLYRYLKLDENQYANVSLPFADLGSIPAYAIPAVKALYAEGVITGSEKNGQLYFNPGSSLTRAQAAAMIGRTQAKGYALADLTFTDSAQIPTYAAYYIRAMVGQGVINGYSDGSFKPHSNITRGQMAKILYNLM